MDFWDQPYYKTTKRLLSILGQWPYQSSREIIPFRIIGTFFFALQTVTECLALRYYYHDLQMVMASCSLFLVHIKVVISIINLSFNFKRERDMLEKIQEDFKYLHEDHEQRILHEYAGNCGRLSILYTVIIYVSAMLFASEPVILRFIHVFIKFNQTIEKFFMPMEFPGVDVDQCYYGIIMLSEIAVFLIATSIIASDLLLFVFSHHASALFAALGDSVENLPIDDGDGIYESGFKYLRTCIQKHNRAISFARSVDDVFVWDSLSTVGLNMLVISFTALQVLLNTAVIMKLVKNALFVVAQSLRLYVLCSVAQHLMDISTELQAKLIYARWYRCPLKTQNLIKLMIMRSQIPSTLSAGKMVLMSMETFSVVIKTSVSYLTVFMAMQ